MQNPVPVKPEERRLVRFAMRQDLERTLMQYGIDTLTVTSRKTGTSQKLGIGTDPADILPKRLVRPVCDWARQILNLSRLDRPRAGRENHSAEIELVTQKKSVHLDGELNITIDLGAGNVLKFRDADRDLSDRFEGKDIATLNLGQAVSEACGLIGESIESYDRRMSDDQSFISKGDSLRQILLAEGIETLTIRKDPGKPASMHPKPDDAAIYPGNEPDLMHFMDLTLERLGFSQNNAARLVWKPGEPGLDGITVVNRTPKGHHATMNGFGLSI